MINYYTIQPSAALAKYVRFFWVLEGDLPGAGPYTHRTMADGCVEMFFHYQGIFDELQRTGEMDKSPAAGFSGPTRHYNRFRINESFGMFGVYLYPFALPVLFNIPAEAISDQLLSLKTLLGGEGEELEEKMMLAADNRLRVQIMTGYLEQKLAAQTCCEPAVFAAVHYIIQNKGLVNVEDMAARHFLSARQFERKFKQCSGFAPKLYSRITRFQSVLSEYGNQHQSLSEIAQQCGYYDQSHFIHEFKEFSGYHPRSFFSGNAEGNEWREG
ncbi:MAG: helix-turn-helix domain-containing protein [Sphingobacteriales bacterium]|nr:helix-turn-helix domain-containing protein [Sphingobacteriales bacterium]